MKVLSSNRDLYEYLLFLVTVLKQRGSTALSEDVELASRQVSTFPATEFLGESKLALKRVLSQENGILTDQERNDLCNVLEQLDNAFNRR